VFRGTCCCSADSSCGSFQSEVIFESVFWLFGVVFCLLTCSKSDLAPLSHFLPLFEDGLSVKTVILNEEKFYEFLPLYTVQ
jgi:hypothetical protein